MNYISIIKRPIESEFQDFLNLFSTSLTHDEGILSQALERLRSRGGKRMRPLLTLLMAKNFGQVNSITQHSAVGLELLHTASLVHDDVVDESGERRGQASMNATYNNKIAVLVGDYILSTSLLYVSLTRHPEIIQKLARLGQTLSNGEIVQLNSVGSEEVSERVYFDIIERKTAALFEACAGIGAQSVAADEEAIAAAEGFGLKLGQMFQIRDDIFDYFDEGNIGKPTGNDMLEGKLTLPAIYTINNCGSEEMREIAMRVKNQTVSSEEIKKLVDYTIASGGIDYAEKRMNDLRKECDGFVEKYVSDDGLKEAFTAYLDFIVKRDI